jgi:hypothetical protein
LLSLDAPTVAVLWAWGFARASRVALTVDSLLLLFSGTWLLYVADRIFDGFHQESSRLRERHFFYMRHRGATAAAALPVAALLAWLVWAHMLPGARRADFLIFAVALTYFLLVHLCHAAIERWFPKELIVGLVFAAATVVPAWARLEQNEPVLFPMAALFAALCWLNCIAIEKWERNPRSAHSADRTMWWGQQHLRNLCAASGVIATFFAAGLLWEGHENAAELCAAAALSALLLSVLDWLRLRFRLSAFHLRVAADAALLTPLLLLFR